jgi:hypothetical protein
MALPAVSFKQITGLIPYEAMVVNEKMKESQLCPFLSEMDRKEYEVLKLENIQIEGLEKKWAACIKLSGVFFITCLAGLIPFFHGLNKDLGGLIETFGGMFLVLIGFALAERIFTGGQSDKEKEITKLYDARILRLGKKTEDLEAEIKNSAMTDAVKLQLTMAKDIFVNCKNRYSSEIK